MDFNKEQFDGLKYNPYNLNSKSYTNVYPEIARLKGFEKGTAVGIGLEKEKVARYIMYLYQPGTPLLDIPDLMKRKIEAAKLAGFPLDSSEKQFEPSYMNVILCRNDASNKMIIQFLRKQHNHLFAQYAYYQEMFWIESNSNLEEEDAAKRKSSLANLETLSKRIEILEKKLLMDDNSRGLIEQALEEVEAIDVHLRVEDVAAALSEGKDPLNGFNPYGEGYDFPVNEDINEAEYKKLKQQDE